MGGAAQPHGLDRCQSACAEHDRQNVLSPLYGTVGVVSRADLWPREHSGLRPVILTPNHKNFLDAFFVGLATNRHIRFMAKAELFKGPVAWLFLRLGAFPVRRGEADQDAVETAPRSSPAAWW